MMIYALHAIGLPSNGQAQPRNPARDAKNEIARIAKTKVLPSVLGPEPNFIHSGDFVAPPVSVNIFILVANYLKLMPRSKVWLS